MPTTKPWILMSAPTCHLCDDAAELLQQAGVAFIKQDITLDAALMRRFALRIPVLQAPTGTELSWPFEVAAVQALMESIA
jgi:hypothetical protein